jgi:hypothetical protein
MISFHQSLQNLLMTTATLLAPEDFTPVAETDASLPVPTGESPPAAVQSCEVEIITGLDRIHAFLVRGSLAPAQRDHLYRMVPERFRLDIELTNRWKLDAVIADPYWAERQREIAGETPPRGVRLVFVPAGATGPVPLITTPAT